jgi:DNA-binding transcriptional ArsR family regulator
MPRAAVTSDVFNAIAEPRRRHILLYLAPGEKQVGDIVTACGLGQPSVSKHLKVLYDTGLVSMRRDGRRILYKTNLDALRPVREWAESFDRFWTHQLLRVKERAEAEAKPDSKKEGKR